jgi:hypothetical protein
MQVWNTFFRSGLSLVLALTLATVFSLSAFAAPSGENDPSASSTLSGMLTGTGRVTINGNAAQSGATVLSGSIVETGKDGSASIDLGPLGQVDLQPNTSVMLVMMPGMVQMMVDRFGVVSQSLPAGVVGRVKMQSQAARFTVARGHVEVSTSGGQRSLNGGEENSFDGASEAVISANTSFQLESENDDDNQPAQGDGDDPPVKNSATIGAGPLGYIVLAGLAGGIVLGVMAGSNGHGTGGIPPRASEIVP